MCLIVLFSLALVFNNGILAFQTNQATNANSMANECALTKTLFDLNADVKVSLYKLEQWKSEIDKQVIYLKEREKATDSKFLELDARIEDQSEMIEATSETIGDIVETKIQESGTSAGAASTAKLTDLKDKLLQLKEYMLMRITTMDNIINTEIPHLRTKINSLEYQQKEMKRDIQQHITEPVQRTTGAPEKRPQTQPPVDCYDILKEGKTVSGVYTIYPSDTPKDVYCDQETGGGGWLVFQRRIGGSEDFYRRWDEYAKGFGNIEKEFWVGNVFLANVTAQRNYTLRVDLEDFESESRFAQYDLFAIGPASTKYTLKIGNYSGTAGDSLTSVHNGQPFSTKDQDNDSDRINNCAVRYHGAWWYRKCHTSNLNGINYEGQHASYANGINWKAWRGYHYSFKMTEMKFRPTSRAG